MLVLPLAANTADAKINAKQNRVTVRIFVFCSLLKGKEKNKKGG